MLRFFGKKVFGDRKGQIFFYWRPKCGALRQNSGDLEM